MFSKQLSKAVLRFCESRKLSYETAAELCDISPRYFGSIARGQVAPSIHILEKICLGFGKKPNELLGFSTGKDELSYRIAMPVIHYVCYQPHITHPVCPRCTGCLDREYQAFCDSCGQKLDWDFFQFATLKKIQKTDQTPSRPAEINRRPAWGINNQ